MEKLILALKKVAGKIAGFFTVILVGAIIGNILIHHLVPFKSILGVAIICAVFWILAKLTVIEWLIDKAKELFSKGKDKAKELKETRKAEKAKEPEKAETVEAEPREVEGPIYEEDNPKTISEAFRKRFC